MKYLLFLLMFSPTCLAMTAAEAKERTDVTHANLLKKEVNDCTITLDAMIQAAVLQGKYKTQLRECSAEAVKLMVPNYRALGFTTSVDASGEWLLVEWK